MVGMETGTMGRQLATHRGGCRGAEPTLSMRGVGRSPAGTTAGPGDPVEGGHLEPHLTCSPLSMPRWNLAPRSPRPCPSMCTRACPCVSVRFVPAPDLERHTPRSVQITAV